MELGFNLVFAGVAACAFALWAQTQPKREGRYKHAMLLICALALLFPFISISDDLSSTPDVVEGTIVSAAKVSLTVVGKEFLIAVPAGYYQVPPNSVLGFVASSYSLQLPSVMRSASNGLRSPPLS